MSTYTLRIGGVEVWSAGERLESGPIEMKVDAPSTAEARLGAGFALGTVLRAQIAATPFGAIPEMYKGDDIPLGEVEFKTKWWFHRCAAGPETVRRILMTTAQYRCDQCNIQLDRPEEAIEHLVEQLRVAKGMRELAEGKQA